MILFLVVKAIASDDDHNVSIVFFFAHPSINPSIHQSINSSVHQWEPPVGRTEQTKYLSFLTDPIARYISFGLPGLGMFSEAYIIFSVGNIGNFQKWAFPACYAPNDYSGTACDQEVIHQKIDSYIQICGIMVRRCACMAVSC